MVKRQKVYFYSGRGESVFDTEVRYVVYAVEIRRGNVNEAEYKAKTIAQKHNDTLTGGYFFDNCKPWNFKDNYTVINVPTNTNIKEVRKNENGKLD